MCSQRLRFEFRVELAAQEPRMIRQLNDFHEVLVGRYAGNNQPIVRQRLFKLAIEFVAVAVPLGNDS